MRNPRSNTIVHSIIVLTLMVVLSGCAQLRVPRIDPLGRTLFLPAPSSTQILTPGMVPQPDTLPLVVGPNLQPTQGTAVQPQIQAPPTMAVAPQAIPAGPAFTQPSPVPTCNDGSCGAKLQLPRIQPKGSLISHRGEPHRVPHRNRDIGMLTTTPHRIVAPVGSEVVVLAGICGKDGNFVANQPIEWMLSQDSAGQIIEVGGMEHPMINKLLSPSARKFTGDYAWGRTGLKPKILTRGTDTPADDQQVSKGQTYITLTSGSEGTSYLTTVAPKTDAWPERKSITRIHWVDGIWSIPLPTTASAGKIHPMTTLITRTSDGTGVAGWTVRYQIVGGVAAEFSPSGTQTAEIKTNAKGQAIAEIRQPAGKAVVGPTQVRIEVVRPGVAGGREVTLESGITTVNWSAPALTIRAIGPRTAGVNQPFNYRVEVTNPGDQVARAVKVSSSDIGDNVQYISSSPSPSQYGNRYEWNLGDIQPGSQPQILNIQLKSAIKGAKTICFEVSSETDQIKTEACAETNIAVPCIGLAIKGPTKAGVGEDLPFQFDITNQCDRPLENVTIRINYDTALSAEGVPNPAEIGPIARILPGETRNIPALTFRALQPGTHCFNMEITSSAGDTSRARRCIEIENTTQTQVRVEMESQGVVRLGNEVLVKMKVTNLGNVTLNDVTLMNSFSRSLTPSQVSPEFKHSWMGDDLAFALGQLGPNQTKIVDVKYKTTQVDGNAFSRATVTTPLGASDQTAVSIRVETNAVSPGAGTTNTPTIGIPAAPTNALTASVSALDRTVQVGNFARFQVTITNARSVTDQQVAITLLVPPGTRLQAPDPTQTGLRIIEQSADGSVVKFEPRLEMRAGENLSFPIALQVLQAGQITFAVQVSSARTPNKIEAMDAITAVP